MKRIRDRFSLQADRYKKYRPTYPYSLYKAILEYTPGRENLWDCASGNGQVATALATEFEQVYATDISSRQLQQAPAMPNIQYSEQRAENTRFEDSMFDLITVAQAIHWFDITAFLKEASRVSREGGVLAVWGYGLMEVGPDIDPHIQHFYKEITGPYWDGERVHIDQHYGSIPLNLERERDLGGHRIELPMDLEALLGYFSSWSSVQNYIRENGDDPVEIIGATLKEIWKPGETRTAVFPIFGTMGRVVKVPLAI